MLVYDITDASTFESIQTWIDIINENCDKNVLKILIGNKQDLKENRAVCYNEGKDYAEKNNMLFFEVSAKEGNNIEKIFNESGKVLLEGVKRGTYDIDDPSTGITCKNKKSKNKKLETVPQDKNSSNCCPKVVNIYNDNNSSLFKLK